MSEPDDIPAPQSLTKASSWRDLVSVYTQAIADIRQGIDAANAAVGRLDDAFALGTDQRFRISARGRGYVTLDADHIVEQMQRAAWAVIVDRLELHRMMPVKKWEELQRQLEKGALPDITEANVRAFARQYETQLPGLLRDMVVEVFDWLRPPSADRGAGVYKTNSREEIGKRVVLTWMVQRWDRYNTGWHLGYSGRPGQQLIALENVFHALDGRGSIAKTNRSAIENGIREATNGRGETEYFRFQAFKNGNLHLEFKRLDLLARFNQIAGGKRLKKGSEAA